MEFKCYSHLSIQVGIAFLTDELNMKCPKCDAKALATDSRTIKRPLGNDLSDHMADRIGLGRRRNYDCTNGHRFTTYELHRDVLLDLVYEACDLWEIKRILACNFPHQDNK